MLLFLKNLLKQKIACFTKENKANELHTKTRYKVHVK